MTAVQSFDQLAAYRSEILAHCYRMSGSIHDAEDLTQETFLRAWRAIESFEGRSSVQTWLYRIATRVCLTALERRSRRPLPSGLGHPAEDTDAPLDPSHEISWLTPFPGDPSTDDPSAIAARNADLRLAFVAALQRLSARQRAVLLLNDVLGLSPREVGDLLDMSTAAIYSALARARRGLGQARDADPGDLSPDDPVVQQTVETYMAAFEAADLDGLAALLADEVRLEMPPYREWYAGRAKVLAFLTPRILMTDGRWRLTPTVANGQPAVVCHTVTSDGRERPHALHVLTVRAGLVVGILSFNDPSMLHRFQSRRAQIGP